MRLHESCLENRSVRSLDALISTDEVDINSRDKVGSSYASGVIMLLKFHHVVNIEWKDSSDSGMSVSPN